MNLKDFVKNVLVDINAGVDEARSLTNRDIRFSTEERTVEFDVAVTVEDNEEVEGNAGIRVLSFAEGGGKIGKSSKNSTVSHVSFGVHVNMHTKDEAASLNHRGY